MGLKFYRNPEEIDAENAAAAKLEHATAQRRSAIRREPTTIRPRRDQNSMSHSLNEIMRHRQDIRQMHMQLNADNIRTDAEITNLESQLQNLRRQRERAVHRLETFRAQTEADGARLLAETSTAPLDPTTPEDPPLTIEHVGLSENEVSIHLSLPRPTRESNLRFEVTATHTARSGPDPTTIPSPPRSVSDTGRSRPVDGPLDNWDSVPNLSHDFAPARRAQAILGEADDTTSAREAVQGTMSPNLPGLETPPPESWEDSYPPLRRVPHMSPRPLPRSPVDGLGDRHRSPSPSAEPQEESTWNNLLSTMDNSNEASSTSTSFASVNDLVAIMASSRSSSHRSSNTQNTSTSFGEIGTSSEETCDLPPGITEDDVRMIRERHRRNARRLPRRRPQRRSESQELGVDASLLRPGSFAGSENDMSRLLMDHVVQRLQHVGESETSPLVDASIFHDIRNRMQRGERIPDDVWAVAGLSPDLFNRS